jgi:hypothetical protein
MSPQRQVMQDYLDSLIKRSDFTVYFTDDWLPRSKGPTSGPSGARRPAS